MQSLSHKAFIGPSQQQHNSTQHQLGAWILWPRIFVLCRRSLLLRLVLGLRSGVEEISEVVGEVLKNSRYNKFHRLIYWAHLVQQLASLGVHVAAGVGVEHLNSINYFENFYPQVLTSSSMSMSMSSPLEAHVQFVSRDILRSWVAGESWGFLKELRTLAANDTSPNRILSRNWYAFDSANIA